MFKLARHIKAFRLSKTSIKTSIKKRTTTTTPTMARAPDDYSFGNVFRAYEQNFIAGGKVTQFDVEEFSALFDDFSGEWVLKGMREAYRQGPEKRNLAYLHGVLKGYRDRGGPDIEKAQSQVSPSRTVTPNEPATRTTKQQQRSNRAAELRRQAEEGRRRDQG